jgi:hypothetical protein
MLALIDAERHLAFLTSVRAYQAYVEYWNSKLAELSLEVDVKKIARLLRLLDSWGRKMRRS